MVTVEEWYRTLPIVTKSWLTIVLALSLISTLGLLDPRLFIVQWNLILRHFHIWRLITPFLSFGPIGFLLFFKLQLLCRNCKGLEEQYYAIYGFRGTVDFIYMLLCGMGLLLVISYLFPFYALDIALLFMLTHIFVRKDPHQQISFYGFTFQNWHSPFLSLVMIALLGGDIVPALWGILVGHLWVFLTDVWRKLYGKSCSITDTPTGLYSLFQRAFPVWASQRGAAAASAQGGGSVLRGPNPPPPPAPARPNWMSGRGYRLDQ